MSKKKSNFGASMRRNRERQKEAKKGFGYLDLPKGVPILKFEENTKRVDLDFLLYTVTDKKHPDRDEQFGDAVEGSMWFRRPFKTHRSVGSDSDTVVCLKSVGKKCPICEYREKRLKEGADWEDLKEIAAKDRSLYVVIPIGIPKFKEIPTIWDMSDYLFQDELNEELETNPENDDFADMESGKTATLKLKWKKFGTNSFPEVRSITFNERDEIEDDIIELIPDLDSVLRVLSYDTLQAKFFETEDEEDAGELQDIDEDEKDETPVRRKKKTVKVKEEEDEEDEKDETPVRKKKKIIEDKEEDEEDETPVRRKKKNKCPHGFVFGVDTEKNDECDTCDVWEECSDKKEGK